MPRAMAPALVTRADIVAVGLDCKPVMNQGGAAAPRLNGEHPPPDLARAATWRRWSTPTISQ
jgi:hypothetical protein